jgi:serine/threonine protein kinase
VKPLDCSIAIHTLARAQLRNKPTRDLAGMAYLEGNKVVHRTLAARNVLVSPNGHSCKISDFGMMEALSLGAEYVVTFFCLFDGGGGSVV